MPSPFPGMDPYIENPEVWSDFHGGIASEIRAESNRLLQPRYVARLTPRVAVESAVQTELPVRLYSVEILETGSLRLVTALEILSPVNKRPGHEAHEEYLHKRRALLRSDAVGSRYSSVRGTPGSC